MDGSVPSVESFDSFSVEDVLSCYLEVDFLFLVKDAALL